MAIEQHVEWVERFAKLVTFANLSAAVHGRLQPLSRLIFLSVGVAFHGVRPHDHRAGVHRVALKARRDFTVSEIIPAVSFTQPFPTARAVRYGSLSAQ